MYVLKDINFNNSYIEKVTLLKICANVYLIEFTTTLAALKSKTGGVVQPITDAADATGLGFTTRPLTSSYNNNYYYVTLTVKLIVVIYR